MQVICIKKKEIHYKIWIYTPPRAVGFENVRRKSKKLNNEPDFDNAERWRLAVLRRGGWYAYMVGVADLKIGPLSPLTTVATGLFGADEDLEHLPASIGTRLKIVAETVGYA